MASKNRRNKVKFKLQPELIIIVACLVAMLVATIWMAVPTKAEKTTTALNNAISLNPSNPVYHRDLGLVYKRLNRFSEAKEHFEKAAASTNSTEGLRAEVLRELESLRLSDGLQEYNKYGQ